MRKVYLDHAGTTPLHPEVYSLMCELMKNTFGNPSSIHSFGREAKKWVDEARQQVADLIEAEAGEIIFTSGGTEADNLAILGVAAARRKKGNHIITSSIEHPAVLNSCKQLAKSGFDVTFLPVDQYGLVDPEELCKAIRSETILISIMHANNEIGTIEPIEEFSRIAKEHGVLFHTDAVQAAGKIPVNVNTLGVDLLTLSSHKIYGPKGVGALYKRKGVRLQPVVYGGGQESNSRSGTENTVGIVGFGKAAEIAARDLDSEFNRTRELRDKLIQGIKERIPDVKYNGHPERRLPHNVNFSFSYVEGESMLLSLDMKGIAASSGSACSSSSLKPSHVLKAIGLPYELIHGSLRMTLGRINDAADIDYVLEILPEVITRLRSFSPLANKLTV
ncbi:MAG: cysteine desulfurase NifS [Syntrophaceticus sp.]|nr:cysteine desulfurase NifS [Syntrophaceticus sp.]MDD3314460.1 cysteine desulfurase NifS [Syntrophaceticus sp.]MDD4360151.1 cysteine desulfurase NifS [Syntrophaceticus sp.]MDD4783147.1 cysteine desulfurase NifS [Syntrophaceticus sp.]HBI27551.1 cysteine desulfurase NifS [Peptococcaceae bacterium]